MIAVYLSGGGTKQIRSLATPTLPASEAGGGPLHPLGRRETILPVSSRAAVLVPPTGNGVLNQIPAGDGRESSREQAVPDDRVPFHRSVLSRARRPSPSSNASWSQRQSHLPDPQKKKKWNEADRPWGAGSVGDRYTANWVPVLSSIPSGCLPLHFVVFPLPIAFVFRCILVGS